MKFQNKLFIILLFAFLGILTTANAQIVNSQYEFGSFTVDASENLYQEDMLRRAELELLGYFADFPENAARDKATLLNIDIDATSGNYNIAIGLLKQFIVDRPNSPFGPQAALQLAFLHFETENYRQAEYDFYQASQIASRQYQLRNDPIYEQMSCNAIYWEGISIVHQGRSDDAIQKLAECAKKCPSDSYADDAIFTQAMLKEIQGEYKEAIQLYRSLADTYPKSNVYIISRIHEANCLLVIKQAASAIRAIENADAKLKKIRYANAQGAKIEQDYLDNISERIQYLRAEAANTAGNYTKALLELDSFLSTYDDSPMIAPVRLSMGYTLLNLKRYDEALDNYNLVIYDTVNANEEMKARALLFRAITYKRLARIEDARQELVLLASQPAFQYSGAALLELGQLYYEQADFTSAKKTLERARREPDNDLELARIQLLLASAYTQLGQWQKAAEEYAAAKKTAKNANKISMPDKDLYIAEAAKGRGVALVNCKRSTEAVPELLQFLSSQHSKGKEDKAVFWLAEAYYSGGMLNNAIENYDVLVKDYPVSDRREEALYSLGWCYFKKKNYSKSSKIFAQLTREFPESKYAIEVWTRQGDAYYVQKNYSQSETAYRKAAQLAPRTDEGQYAAYQLCDVLYRQGKNEAAITELFNFVGKYSKSRYAANALYIIGWIRFQEGKYSEAIDNFNFMITAYKESALVPRAHYTIADAFYNLGQYESAIHSYQVITQQYPADPLVPGAMQGIQYSLSALGRDTEAVQMYDDYVSKSENIASPFVENFAYKKGELYFQSGSYQDAVSEYEGFVSKYPDSEKASEALYYMGKSYDRMNDWDKAIEVFKGIANNYPETEYAPLSLLECGLIKLKQTMVDEADSIFIALKEKYPKDDATARGIFEQAILAMENGDTVKSVNYYEEIATDFPDNEHGIQSRFRLAEHFYSKNMNDSARHHLSHLVSLKEEPVLAAEAQYRIGMLYMRDKNHQQAIIALNDLAEKFPGIDDWYSYGLLALGDALTQLNLIDKAIETYQSLVEWRPSDDWGNTAKERIKRLNQRKESQMKMPPSNETGARRNSNNSNETEEIEEIEEVKDAEETTAPEATEEIEEPAEEPTEESGEKIEMR